MSRYRRWHIQTGTINARVRAPSMSIALMVLLRRNRPGTRLGTFFSGHQHGMRSALIGLTTPVLLRITVRGQGKLLRFRTAKQAVLTYLECHKEGTAREVANTLEGTFVTKNHDAVCASTLSTLVRKGDLQSDGGRPRVYSLAAR